VNIASFQPKRRSVENRIKLL